MPIGSPLTLLNAFDRATRWFAGNEAVVDSAARLSYAQLDEMSRRTAALLRANGLVAGRPVAILSVPSAIYLVAWFGIIRAGGLPMALHVRESGRGLAAICDKMKAPLLIYDLSLEALATEVLASAECVIHAVGLRSALPEVRVPAVRPSAIVPDDLAGYPADLSVAVAEEDDAAVIALSSGTTSVPKCVVHTQRSLVELARTDVYLYGGIRPGDRSLVPLSTAFIGCTNGWLPFINAGACVVFMEKFDLDELVRRAVDERITHIFLTPTLWRRLLNSDLSGLDFGAVRQVGFAAEPMDAPTLKRLRERISPNVVQMYGSTETGAAATCIWADDMVGGRLTSVGRPMLNGDLRVVVPGRGPNDEVPRGEAGEILVTSPSLAAAIWDDPAQTAKAFIEADGRRWWRSGDLGRLDADGFLFVEGRHDDMIISGGINIMPAPVEEALLTHPSVRECAVVGMPDAEWGERVEAFVVVGEQTVDSAALDEHLRAGDLSPYQRPRAYTFVAELPRTPTHKINRRALRDRAPMQTEAQRS